MGRRQVVRHLVLVQAFGGSNPSAPDVKSGVKFISSLFLILLLEVVKFVWKTLLIY